MRNLLLACACCIFLCGCSATNRQAPAEVSSGAAAADPIQTAPSAPTGQDVRISEELRRAILADPSMSDDARNINVVTRNGVITLRGAVANESEKSNIVAKLNGIAGIKAIKNQLEPL